MSQFRIKCCSKCATKWIALSALTVCMLATSLWSASAQAEFVFYQATLPVSAVPSGYSINFPKFTETLGELKKVHFIHSNVYAVSGTSIAVGGTFSSPNWTAGWAYGGDFRFEFTGPGIINAVQQSVTDGGSSTQANPVHTVNISVAATTLDSGDVFIDSTNSSFSTYIGPGTVATNFSSQFIADGGTGGDGVVWSGASITETSTTITSLSQSVVTVAYEYDIVNVPEPNAVLVFSVCIFCSAVPRRKKRL